MDGIGWRGAALAALLLATGCGTARVNLPRHHGMTAAEAVPVVDRAARLNAVAADPAARPDGERAWADAEGWYAWEEGRLVKLYYADIDFVSRTYAGGDDVAASACVAGLMGPFSAAAVNVTMRNGKVWRLQTDPAGAGTCIHCAPVWLVSFPVPVRRTKRLGLAFETLRVRAGVDAIRPL